MPDKNPHLGSTHESLLRQDGTYEEVKNDEIKSVLAYKAPYVNCGHTSHFKGWSEGESQPLLDYLFQHQVRAEFTCRYRWQPGSLAVWDNRCTQHLPINDYDGFRPVMHRVTLAGDRPC